MITWYNYIRRVGICCARDYMRVGWAGCILLALYWPDYIYSSGKGGFVYFMGYFIAVSRVGGGVQSY